MRLFDECFNTVKKDYIEFLNKEKITEKSKEKKNKKFKKNLYTFIFLDRK